MLLSSLLLIPIIGVFVILVNKDRGVSLKNIKFIALTASTLNFLLSLVIFILFDFSTNQFQFVQEYHEISYFDFYLGVDGLSIYFVLLTTIIIPISLLSNWTSISKDVESYVIIILLLETLLLAVFLVLDILLFYIFFESILPPLFILIGIFGSDNRVKASFYLFLYTLLGSLFLLLSILAMSSIMSTTDFDTLFKGNFIYLTQLFLFYGIFIAFAVKTPTIFLNTWLLKAHVESPLGGSIILAAIVLKLSLYGIFRLILPVLPKAYMEYTYIIFLIGVITIVYASLSTLRTIDVKELIAYSSVSHAAVYLIGVFSNSIQGIEGGINLGLAHGLVSPGLFICAGGILYDRSHTRLISFYKGMAQIMPLFAILFFILCLGNCGAPLTLNFVGEFMSLYGVFERSSLYGALASSSIIFSAAYTIYMYQRISFGGSYSKMFGKNIADLNKREFTILLTLVIPTVLFGIYTAPIMDGINYAVSMLQYSFDYNVIHCDSPNFWPAYDDNIAGVDVTPAYSNVYIYESLDFDGEPLGYVEHFEQQYGIDYKPDEDGRWLYDIDRPEEW
jgi:NADH-ubiquinone oxidoreductase chain 4